MLSACWSKSVPSLLPCVLTLDLDWRPGLSGLGMGWLAAGRLALGVWRMGECCLAADRGLHGHIARLDRRASKDTIGGIYQGIQFLRHISPKSTLPVLDPLRASLLHLHDLRFGLTPCGVIDRLSFPCTSFPALDLPWIWRRISGKKAQQR
jgi:hypothetical protein